MQLNVAGLTLPDNLFLAPLAGYTNYPFRMALSRLGATLTFTEMVSAKGLFYNSEETKKLLYCGDEFPKGAQLFGSDPAILRAACESELLAPFDVIDLNMGCPVPKIVKNGEGSALLENLPLAEKIIKECVKSGKRISVKFRVGVGERRFAAEIAKTCEGAGACMLTVHGRTREEMYAGTPDYNQIAAAKRAVSIPVIANGGVFSASDAHTMYENTGADGIMVARAALFDFNIFHRLRGEECEPVLPHFLRFVQEERDFFGEKFALVFTRKIASFLLKGKSGAAEKRVEFLRSSSTDEVISLATQYIG